VRLTIDVATASVGLTMAPRATPWAKPRPGTAISTTQPIARADETTTTIDSQPIDLRSRRKSIAGMLTDAA
jgi:hypothetical protein